MWRAGVLGLVLAVSACASVSPSSPPPPPPAPDFAAVPSAPAPARAVLYADCLSQAITKYAMALVDDGDTQLLQFTCTGAPAQRFNEALSVMGEAAGSVWSDGDTTFRATTKVRANLFGVDYCAKGPGLMECRIVLNTGPFLTAKN